MILRLRLFAPTGELIREQDIREFPADLGSDPTCAVSVDGSEYRVVSGQHARIVRLPSGLLLTHLSQKNRTYLNELPVAGMPMLKSGDRIRLGGKNLGVTIELTVVTEPAVERPRASSPPPVAATPPPAPIPPPPPSPAPPPPLSPPPARVATPAPPPPPSAARNPAADSGSRPGVRTPSTANALPEYSGDATVAAKASDIEALRRFVHTTLQEEIGDGGILGRDPDARFQLPHPLVSRRHAEIRIQGRQVILADLGSNNGTYLNGRRLTRETALREGDSIDIGPYSLSFDGAVLSGATRTGNAELVARGLSRVVTDRANGKPLTLLRDVNLVVKPREFVALLGPSGSGKSTLLTMLSGRATPNAGAVLLNGQDLYSNFEALKRDIAVVPQRDILHESLAVGAALQFTGELRLPADTASAEVGKTVSDTLSVVGLTHRRETLIRQLSGGQVKRASLANELLCQPTLLFLDEVTSGLDEQTDRDLMALFRQIADGGKTVVCITHNLANVETSCHLVAILTEGGRLAFVGTPEEAKEYFGIDRLGEVYRTLAKQTPDEWESRFAASAFYEKYVASRLPPARMPTLPAPENSQSRDKAPLVRQSAILTRRYVAVWRGDNAALMAMLGQSLLVAFLLCIVFADLPGVTNLVERAGRAANLLFLLNVSCFWLGCNNAAKEIVRERAIYRRERAINLRSDSYYASKYLVLLTIGILQATLLLGIVRIFCSPAGSVFGQWFALMGLMAAGTALGLLLSALSPTEEVATAVVPLAVIPQIVLAGVIAPLSGFGDFLGHAFITCFWGRRALEGLLPATDMTYLGRDELAYFPQLLMVMAHTVFFVTATVLLLAQQNRLMKIAERMKLASPAG